MLLSKFEVEWLTSADIEGEAGNAEVPLVTTSSMARIDWQGGIVVKKVHKAKAKNSKNKVDAIANHSTRTLNRIFSLILFFLLAPLVFFNFLWFLDVQLIILSNTFLNLVRLVLLFGFIAYILQGKSKKFLDLNSISGFVIFALIAIATQINRAFSNHPDTNSDSITSHLLLTEAISTGWNPLKPEGEGSSLISSVSLLIQADLSESRVEAGIGFQTIQAFYNLLLGVESSYLFVNILLLTLTAAKLLEVFQLLEFKKRTMDTLGGKKSPIGAILLFLMSPIVIQQVNSAYTDLAVYCLLVCCILVCARMFLFDGLEKSSVISFIVLLIITPSIKLHLTALIIPLVLAFLYVITGRCLFLVKDTEHKRDNAFHIKKLRQPRVLISIFALISLVYFPIGKFASNILKGKLPFLTDKSLVDNSWNGSIPEFIEMNGFERVQTVITGRTSLNPSEILIDGLFSIPTRSERKNAGFLDSRVAGFGPLWGDLLFISSLFALGSIILVVYLNHTRKTGFDFEEIQVQKKRLYFSAYLLLSYTIISLLMPLSFMARYYPQYIAMAFLSIYIIFIVMKIVNSHILLNLILKIVFRTSLLLIVLNFQIVFTSHLDVKSNSSKLIQQMKAERISLQSSGEFKEVKYYFRNKTGLILATTGEISQQSFSKNATVECKESDKLVLITDETGLCGIR